MEDAIVVPVTTVALVSSGARTLAWTGHADGTAVLRDGQGRPHASLRLFDRALTCIATVDDGSVAIAGSSSGEVAVWRTGDGLLLDRFQCASAVKQASILGPSCYVTIDSRRRGNLWQRDGKTLHGTPITSDGTLPLGVDAFGAPAGAGPLTLVTALSWKRWSRPANRVTAEFSPIDGGQLAQLDGLAGVCADGAHCFVYWDDYCVFDAASGALESQGPARIPANAAALTNDGKWLCIGTPTGRICAIDGQGRIATRRKVATAGIAKVSLSRDGTQLGWIDALGRYGVLPLPWQAGPAPPSALS